MNDLKQAVANLKTSEYLVNSPVAYMIELLEQYANHEFSPTQLASTFKKQTLEAQFYFSHMPSELIDENRRLFKLEFEFADKLYHAIMAAGTLDEASSVQVLTDTITEYNVAYAKKHENPKA